MASAGIQLSEVDFSRSAVKLELLHRLMQISTPPSFRIKEAGMGIGLKISRSIIEFQGGRLWYEPSTDGGTIFYLTLPVQLT